MYDWSVRIIQNAGTNFQNSIFSLDSNLTNSHFHIFYVIEYVDFQLMSHIVWKVNDNFCSISFSNISNSVTLSVFKKKKEKKETNLCNGLTYYILVTQKNLWWDLSKKIMQKWLNMAAGFWNSGSIFFQWCFITIALLNRVYWGFNFLVNKKARFFCQFSCKMREISNKSSFFSFFLPVKYTMHL